MDNLSLNGVYTITNTVNKKIYVGSTANKMGFRERWRSHLNALKRGKHCNIHLQNAFNKYGENTFVFDIVLICSKEECKVQEQIMLDKIKSYNSEIGYNICKKAGNSLGRKHSEETKKKIATNRIYGPPANKGKKMSIESRLKMSKSQRTSEASKKHRDRLANDRKLKHSKS